MLFERVLSFALARRAVPRPHFAALIELFAQQLSVSADHCKQKRYRSVCVRKRVKHFKYNPVALVRKTELVSVCKPGIDRFQYAAAYFKNLYFRTVFFKRVLPVASYKFGFVERKSYDRVVYRAPENVSVNNAVKHDAHRKHTLRLFGREKWIKRRRAVQRVFF